MEGIFELIDKLGFRGEIVGNVAKIYDKETGKQMELYGTNELEIPLDNLVLGMYYTFILREEKKMLRLQFTTPIIDRQRDSSKLILESLHYDIGNGSNIIEFDYGRDKIVKIKTAYLGGNEIHIYDDNYIFFDINNKTGQYNNGYEEGWELYPDEMREVINTNPNVQLFTDYYGKLYPGLINTVQNAKTGVKTQ